VAALLIGSNGSAIILPEEGIEKKKLLKKLQKRRVVKL
jgi:hypothetical protein